MSDENMQSTTEQVNQFLSAKLAPFSASVDSISQDSPIEPYSVQIRIVPTDNGSGSMSTQANALAAQIINALDLTEATTQPMGGDGVACMTLQAEYRLG